MQSGGDRRKESHESKAAPSREDRRNGPCLELRVCDRTPPRQTSSKSPFHRFSQHRLSSYLRCCFTSSLDEAESANMRTASLSRCVVCSEFAPCRLYSELVQSALQLGKGVPQAFASTQVGHLPRRGPPNCRDRTAWRLVDAETDRRSGVCPDSLVDTPHCRHRGSDVWTDVFSAKSFVISWHFARAQPVS